MLTQNPHGKFILQILIPSLLSTLLFDIVSEICAHADLGTIFSLSRVNQHLHQLLVDDLAESGRIWDLGRENAGLPKLNAMEVVEDGEVPRFTFVDYAVLMYGRGCQVRQRFALGRSRVKPHHSSS